MSLQRYRLVYREANGWETEADAVPDGLGPWCRAKDAMAEIRRLQAELERHKRAIEFCLDNAVFRGVDSTLRWDPHKNEHWVECDPPADLADIIRPRGDG